MSKIVLISGASAGMGKETAILLAQNGYKVYGAARRLEKMQDLVYMGITPIKMDITVEASITAGVGFIIQKEGRIDILVNNAGFGAYGAFEDVSLNDAKYQLDVNVFGAARLAQLVLPHMRKNNYGKIINISSIGGTMAFPFGSWYHASKFALEALSDSLRNEVKQFGIDVVVIQPGGVKSEWAGIAYENMQKNSANSAYGELGSKISKFMNTAVEKNAEPIVIAKLIKKAIESAKPKTRYLGGYMASSLMVNLMKIIPDRWKDKMIMSQAK